MKILIVDDHVVLLEAVALMLERLIPDAMVRAASDIADALRLQGEAGGFDVLLLDLFLPGVDGMDALAAFRARHPTLPVLMLSSSIEAGHARQALAAGALGYVPKSASPQTLVSAIRMVLDGDVYVPPLLLSEAAPAPLAPELGLTQRQTEVLLLLARGQSNKEIGRELGLSEKTIKVHVGAIFRRLGVTRRMQAAERARTASLA